MRENEIKKMIRDKVRKVLLENISVKSTYTLTTGRRYTYEQLLELGFSQSEIEELEAEHYLHHHVSDQTYSRVG